MIHNISTASRLCSFISGTLKTHTIYLILYILELHTSLCGWGESILCIMPDYEKYESVLLYLIVVDKNESVCVSPLKFVFLSYPSFSAAFLRSMLVTQVSQGTTPSFLNPEGGRKGGWRKKARLQTILFDNAYLWIKRSKPGFHTVFHCFLPVASHTSVCIMPDYEKYESVLLYLRVMKNESVCVFTINFVFLSYPSFSVAFLPVLLTVSCCCLPLLSLHDISTASTSCSSYSFCFIKEKSLRKIDKVRFNLGHLAQRKYLATICLLEISSFCFLVCSPLSSCWLT